MTTTDSTDDADFANESVGKDRALAEAPPYPERVGQGPQRSRRKPIFKVWRMFWPICSGKDFFRR